MKTAKYVLAVALGLIALAAPRQAQADALTLSPTGFGVGAIAGDGNRGCCVNPVTGLNFQNGVSTLTVNSPTDASLTADLTSPTANSPITLGFKLTDIGTPGGELVAADGFTILGGPATANFTISGTFSAGDPVDSEFGMSIATYANPSASVASIFFSPGSFGGSYSVNGGAFVPYANGTAVPLSVPITAADMGIIVTESGFNTGFSLSSPYVIDFLDPLTIGFTPAVGGEVDLATGQKIFGPTAATPEPSSLLLLATGLAGLTGMGLYKNRPAQR